MIKFDDINLSTLDVMPLTVEIGAPPVKTYSVSVPCADGEIDITEFFGNVRYSNRTITIGCETYNNVHDQYELIQSTLHGKKFAIQIDDDDYVYIGRVFVDGWKRNKSTSVFTLSCNCEPYKVKKQDTTQTLNAGDNVVYNALKSVIPTFTLSSATTITYGGYSVTLSAGEYQIPAIELQQGNNTINVTAQCSIRYREGIL